MSRDHVELVLALTERWNSGERDFAKLADYFDLKSSWNRRSRRSPVSPIEATPEFGSDDRIARMEIYANVNQALEAVGLEAWVMSTSLPRQLSARTVDGLQQPGLGA